MSNEKRPALPEPDADARTHSARVSAFIRAQIEANQQWISLHDYLQHALYAPGLGYYVAGAQRFGADGDFITAPELTPLYARTWATPLASALNNGTQTSLLELGAGSGIFAATVLPALRDLSALPERYCILEKSPALRAQQQQTLHAHVPDLLPRVEWLEQLPATFNGSVFMNEVLDALPPHFIVRRQGRWYERGVTLNNDRFALALRPLADTTHDHALQKAAAARLPEPDSVDSNDEEIVELNLAAEALVRTLAHMPMPRGSALFISDYGFARDAHIPPAYRHGTLRGYYRHHLLDDPFVWPGLVDLTTHVDFAAIASAAQEGGLSVQSFQLQSEFLLAHGLLDHLQNCGEPVSPAYLQASRAVQTLLAPEDMGAIFKVLTLAAP